MTILRRRPAACLAAALCLLAPSVRAYLALPPVAPNEEGKVDCWHTCATADYYGDGPHTAVDGGNNGSTTLCFVPPGQHGNEGLFGTKGGGEACHVVKPSNPGTRYSETSGYMCVCANVDGEGTTATAWAPFGTWLDGMYSVEQDASKPCRIPLEGGGWALGSLQVSAENVAVCAAPYWTGDSWGTTSVDLSAGGAGVEVLFAQ